MEFWTLFVGLAVAHLVWELFYKERKKMATIIKCKKQSINNIKMQQEALVDHLQVLGLTVKQAKKVLKKSKPKLDLEVSAGVKYQPANSPVAVEAKVTKKMGLSERFNSILEGAKDE